MLFWQNFTDLCRMHKTTPTQVAEKLGVARGCITKWKNGALPNKSTRQKLAEYFGVSIDSLFAPTVTQRGVGFCLSGEERELIALFRRLPDREKRLVLVIANALSVE